MPCKLYRCTEHHQMSLRVVCSIAYVPPANRDCPQQSALICRLRPTPSPTSRTLLPPATGRLTHARSPAKRGGADLICGSPIVQARSKGSKKLLLSTYLLTMRRTHASGVRRQTPGDRKHQTSAHEKRRLKLCCKRCFQLAGVTGSSPVPPTIPSP